MNWNKDLPASAVEAIRLEVHGEPVLWAARPDPGVAFRKATVIWGFAIPWCAVTFTIFGIMTAVALFGKTPVSQVTAGQFVSLVAGLIFTGSFVLLGLVMLAAPFWAQSCARRTVYAMTAKKLLTIEMRANGANKVTSFAPQSVVRLERSERRDGSGTLKMVLGYTKDTDGDDVEKAEEWIGILDVRTAERLLESLRSARPV